MTDYKRGFLEIVSEILTSLSNGPLIKTHVTFKCKLDSRAVSKYLRTLQDYELIKKSENGTPVFIITEKGKEFLEQYQSLMRLFEHSHVSNEKSEAQKIQSTRTK